MSADSDCIWYVKIEDLNYYDQYLVEGNMKIDQITYHNHELAWRFEPIHFSDMNLLVGVSGVGKTQILKSIMNLKRITRGASLNGVEWDVSFTSDGFQYRWTGEFENKKLEKFIIENQDNDESSENYQFKVIREQLYKNQNLIIDRNKNQFIFDGRELPKEISISESAIKILGDVELVAPVKACFDKVIYSDQHHGNNSIPLGDFLKLNNTILDTDYSSLESIQKSNFLPQIKLALAYTHNHEVFEEIKQNFIYIFEQVEDIKIEPYNSEDVPKNFVESLLLAEYPLIKIKEKGVNHWINQNRISAGMFRTLMHITELYLSSEGTVILIDEFENSLGVNCIDILGDLLSRTGKLQFIITSHHPYIINKIRMDNWKIVTRKGGMVTVKDAKDYNLGRSKHEAFIQLINHPDYTGGIKIE